MKLYRHGGTIEGACCVVLVALEVLCVLTILFSCVRGCVGGKLCSALLVSSRPTPRCVASIELYMMNYMMNYM